MPSIKNVQQLSVLEITQELDRLKQLAAKGQLSPSDLSGGTFTLSNIGTIGGTALHPVLVDTQVCIGALGRVQRLPRFETKNGQEVVIPHSIMTVSFNADHRVIDGATVARFVQRWKQLLEQPASLCVQLK